MTDRRSGLYNSLKNVIQINYFYFVQRTSFIQLKANINNLNTCNMSSVQSEINNERKDIQKILIALNNITLDMKRQAEDIEEFVKENGHLITTVNMANETLSKRVEEMGMITQKIIDTSKIIGKQEPWLKSNVELIASLTARTCTITEQLAGNVNTDSD